MADAGAGEVKSRWLEVYRHAVMQHRFPKNHLLTVIWDRDDLEKATQHRVVVANPRDSQ